MNDMHVKRILPQKSFKVPINFKILRYQADIFLNNLSLLPCILFMVYLLYIQSISNIFNFLLSTGIDKQKLLSRLIPLES